MTTAAAPSGPNDEGKKNDSGKKKINLRRPDIMEAVSAQVLSHYRSEIVERVRSQGGVLTADGLTVKLAKEFGFCYGVERAIDLAYAARKYFSDVSPLTPIYLLGEIIHNPEVNDQISNMGIQIISPKPTEEELSRLESGDAVIIPAFGTEVSTRKKLEAKGCILVDTTCGDVMSVWKRVRQYSKEHVTSIIHGKAKHEETKATTSQARAYGSGHYLVVYNLAETDYVCNYILHGGDKHEFLKKFEGAFSAGFDPDLHLQAVGVANQTTMLRGETEEVQRRFPPRHGDQAWRGEHRKAFPLLRHDLRRDPGPAGRAGKTAARADEPAHRRRRLQFLEHVASRRDGRSQAADLLHQERREDGVRQTHPPLRPAQGSRKSRRPTGCPAATSPSASPPAPVARTI